MITPRPPRHEIDFADGSYLLEESKGNYVYIASAPVIKNLVFSGGGAKGAAYPGVQEALEEPGPNGISMREQVEAVAGSSVGAMQAAFFAAGGRAADLKKKTENLNFKSLLGSSPALIHKDGLPLYNFVNELMQSAITSLLKDNHYTSYPRYEFLSDNDRSHVDRLLAQAKQPGGIVPPITFGMLHSLHELDPANFKDLSVTATRRDTGETYIFNAENTPDLDIALACRASASLPIFLKPVQIETKYLPGGPYQEESLLFVDGGYLDNIPVSALDGKQIKEKGVNEGEQGQNLHTMAFIFDETKKKGTVKYQSAYHEANQFGENELYEPSRLEKFARNKIPEWVDKIGGKARNTEAKARGLKEINMQYTQRNLPLSVGGVSSSDFKKAQKSAQAISDGGREAMRDYIKAHADEGIYLSEKNPIALMLALPSEKLEAIIEANHAVYNIPLDDLKKINNFRLEATNLIHEQSVNAILFRYLAGLAQVPGNKQAHMDFIVYTLRRDRNKWEAALSYAKDNKDNDSLSPEQNDILQAVLRQDAKDQLFAKQKELLQWIRQTKRISRYPANLTLLDQARAAVMKANNFDDLAKAVSKIQTGYATRLSNLSLSSLLRRSKPSKEAEAQVSLIKDQSKEFDSLLPAEAPAALQPVASAPSKASWQPATPNRPKTSQIEADLPKPEETQGPSNRRP